MNCLICQQEMTQFGRNFYCRETAWLTDTYGLLHCVYFSKNFQIVCPPFVIQRCNKDKVLKVKIAEFGADGFIRFNLIMTAENTQQEDLLEYAARFQKLKAFS